MLIDLIKDSVSLRTEDRFVSYNEDDNSKLNKKIISSFIEKGNKVSESEIIYHLNVDDSGMFPSFSMSVVNRPVVKNIMELVKVVNETSIKFNKVNVTFQIIDKKPIIIITTSFYFIDDIESLLFKEGGRWDYNRENDESKNAAKKISSILGSMIIALLEASMFIDENSLSVIDELSKTESENVEKQ